jgi:serine/threonine-protein kinase
MPEQIGKYTIEGVLGQGAMGVVYRGLDASLQRTVAIKTIHSHLLGGPAGAQLLQRFKTEATAAARCQHANIVTVYDFGQHEGTPYIAMEFVSGRGLDELLQERPRLPLKRINTLMIGICRGLHYAHQRGIVHRDIKPANIMVLAGDGVKIADFGIARIAAASDMTQGFALGTPSYMAPEQRSGAEVDQRADIFALGVLLFELLSVCSDFPAAGQLPVKAIKELPPSKKLDYARCFPASMAAFLESCLAADPDKRLGSVAALVDAYKLALQNIRSSAPTDLDGTVVAGSSSAPVAPAPVQDTAARELLLTELEQRLAGCVGPIAHGLVRAAQARQPDALRLVDELAAEIPAPAERQRFIRDCYNSPALRALRSGDTSASTLAGVTTAATGVSLGGPARQALEKALAFHIGPMAAFVLEAHLPQVASPRALLQALADEIPDPVEKAQFLAAARGIAGLG